MSYNVIYSFRHEYQYTSLFLRSGSAANKLSTLDYKLFQSADQQTKYTSKKWHKNFTFPPKSLK